MKKSIDELINELFETESGTSFFEIKNELLKSKAELKDKVINTLLNYTQNGKIMHVRSMILPDIIKLINDGDEKYAKFFEDSLENKNLAYWSIDGFIKTFGKKAYPKLIDIILDSKKDLNIRSKAVKSLSQHSNQCFDRNLPQDPSYWKKSDIRVGEIKDWSKSGYIEGSGYSMPQRHHSLDKPISEFENIVSNLDKKLLNQRNDSQDLSNPSNWLIIADNKVIAEIKKRWKLPKRYLDFLSLYSPLNVSISNDNFIDLNLFGAEDFIEGQLGYLIDPKSKSYFEDWPRELIVIATDNGDPYCLDLSKSDGGDAPVYYAMHGMGEWDFSLYCDSFSEFIELLSED